MDKTTAIKIREKRVNFTIKEMADIFKINENKIKVLCYKAALKLKEDHSIYPWTK